MQPLNLYAVVGGVEGLPNGVYEYLNKDHSVMLCNEGVWEEGEGEGGRRREGGGRYGGGKRREEGGEEVQSGTEHLLTSPKDHRDLVSKLSCNQEWMQKAAVIFIITGEAERSSAKYGPAGLQYVREGEGKGGEGSGGKGREGKGREGREGKGREGKGREGKGREGKGREGKGREGKEREGKGKEK
jgi:hypothetical protein